MEIIKKCKKLGSPPIVKNRKNEDKRFIAKKALRFYPESTRKFTELRGENYQWHTAA